MPCGLGAMSGRAVCALPSGAATPTLSAVPSTLTLGTTRHGTAGTPQTYTLTGTNLTADVTVTAPIGVEVSTDGATYAGSVIVPQVGGSVSATIYVRIAATAAVGAVSGNVVNASAGATDADVAVTGTVTAAAGAPTVGGLSWWMLDEWRRQRDAEARARFAEFEARKAAQEAATKLAFAEAEAAYEAMRRRAAFAVLLSEL